MSADGGVPQGFGIGLDRVDTLNDRLRNIVSLCSLIKKLTHINACAPGHIAQLEPRALHGVVHLVQKRAEDALEVVDDVEAGIGGDPIEA